MKSSEIRMNTMEDDHNTINEEQMEPMYGWNIQDTHEERISFSDVAPVDIRMRQVSVDVAIQKSVTERIFNKQHFLLSSDVEAASPKANRILNRISADFPRNSLCAIMGGSGSGKTTLLNLLLRRMQSSTMVLSSSVLYNGSPDISTVTSAYVTQMDLLLPLLTVRETLLYAAALHLPSRVTATEHRNLMEEIVLKLGLKECANTQMLSNPSVLFYDEPTTGLDVTSAYQLIKMLKSLASKGRTIICTIHQPRHDIFFLFDRITLLSQGFPVYSGPTNAAVTWFESRVPGSFSELVNPADDLIGVVAIDHRSPKADLKTRTQLQYLVESWTEESLNRFPSTSLASGREISGRPAKVVQSAGVWQQIWVLTSCTICTTIRDPMGLTASWIEAVIMGLVCGLVFLNLPKTLAGIRSWEAALYIACGLQFYGFAALVANEFSDKFYDCPDTGGPMNPACIQYTGNFILENLSFHPHWYTMPVCTLFGFVVVFNFIATLLLQFWTVNVQVAGIHTSKDKETDGTERYQAVSGLEKEKERSKSVDINIDLVDLVLTIEKTSLKNSFTKVDIPILHGIMMRFEAGSDCVAFASEITIVPTLRSFAHRTGASNNQPPPSQLHNLNRRVLCSISWPYVSSPPHSLDTTPLEDDNSLLQYLTVREMLRFATGLRLPGRMNTKQKRDRVEEVIRMMGLSDCAGCLIGSEFVKGISGGEKRRVSIAVQVLTEPQILIANEPTSGLDAFTASSILNILSGLAAEGCTVIITIHQSHSELFRKFGNLLLLAKGGRVAYSGKASSMILYFDNLGYRCPSNCNPSNRALDLVSVDLWDKKAEAVTN
ncbi:P-loop containing nucleoside triphosphate hydrolase protein [Lentinula boryana]|uniref:P-loop containing nucleoside triphosphate hydrolase protein n=1 Tax=Lentinula boryana TaxID=40481 RepID=A0ABQ8Q424_9AGAR|nr:P-loop containing nucleoside triphosphate hydrolase protein [Lentinula boryana]